MKKLLEQPFIWREAINYKRNLKNMIFFIVVGYIFIFTNRSILTNFYLICINIAVLSMINSVMDTFVTNIDIYNMEIYLATPLSLEQLIQSKVHCFTVKMAISAVIMVIGAVVILFSGLNFNFGIREGIVFIITLISLRYVALLLGTIALIYLKKSKPLIIGLQVILFIAVNISYMVDPSLVLQLGAVSSLGILSYVIHKVLIGRCIYEDIVKRSVG